MMSRKEAILAAKTGNAWISPDGTIYSCEYYEHRALAEEIINRLGIEVSKETQLSGCYEDELAKRNWVRFECEQINIGVLWEDNLPVELATQPQIDALFDIAMEAKNNRNKRVMENYIEFINAPKIDESDLIIEDVSNECW
jgi:hypothetical protein